MRQSATLVFPTIPLLYAKDQCEVLLEDEIVYSQPLPHQSLCELNFNDLDFAYG